MHPVRPMNLLRGTAFAMLAAPLAAIAVAGPVAADPPGPTDYETSVLQIDPPTDSISFEMIGGDSFVLLTVDRGTSVDVVGYEGEPYLRFESDGRVLRNANSPSLYYNENRYSEATIPPGVSASAEADWVEVATDGRYAWHDHRTHWMNASKPPAADPGDVILEGVVPLRVDQAEVDVVVQSRLLAPPSRWPTIVGVVIGLGVAGVALVLRRPAMGAAVVSLAALGIGAANFLDLPRETGPSLLLWLLPAVAVVFGFASWRLIDSSRAFLGTSLLAICGVELMTWAIVRRPALTAAIIPSPAPSLDRGVIAAAGVAGGVFVIVALHRVLQPRAVSR